MDTNKMALTGAGLMITGIALGAIGAVLVLPAAVSLTARAIEKTGDKLMTEVERGSKILGTAAGTLQRSVREAAKAGVAEIRSTMREPG